MADTRMTSSAPESIISADYQLALKLFMNRDILEAFELSKKLKNVCIQNFERGHIQEDLLVKVLTLYLTEVGLLLNPKDFNTALQLHNKERQQLVKSLEEDELLRKVTEIFGSLADIPPQILYQIFLVYFTCQDILRPDDTNFVLNKFKVAHHELKFRATDLDTYLKRWLDMFIFNVLPASGEFEMAFALVESSQLYNTEKASAKLKEIQELKNQEKKLRDKNKKERETKEAQRIQRERERQRKEKEEKSLKYRLIQQIKREHESRDALKPSASSERGGDKEQWNLDRIRGRLSQLYMFSKSSFQANSPLILAVIVLLFISSRVLRTRKINLREKFKETMQMAFKVTYL